MTSASSENFIEILIDTVRNYPVLYDTAHADYKNNRIKNKIWDNIAEIVGESDGDKLKNKWKNLRDAYSKHLRSNKTHTGQAAKLVERYKTWPWVQQMSFLRPYLEFAITHSNIQGNNEQASTSHQEPPMTDVQSPPSPHQHSRRRKSQQNETQVDKVINFLNKRRNTGDFDDIDLVFLGYAKTIKKMSNSRQARVKFQIAKIIMESELEQEEEASLTTDSSTLQGSGNDIVFTNNNSSQDHDYIVSSPPEPATSFSPQEEDEPHNALLLPRQETTSASYVICTQNQQPTYVDPHQYTIQPTKFYYEQFGKKS